MKDMKIDHEATRPPPKVCKYLKVTKYARICGPQEGKVYGG
jgi:hypothetical protein